MSSSPSIPVITLLRDVAIAYLSWPAPAGPDLRRILRQPERDRLVAPGLARRLALVDPPHRPLPGLGAPVVDPLPGAHPGGGEPGRVERPLPLLDAKQPLAALLGEAPGVV